MKRTARLIGPTLHHRKMKPRGYAEGGAPDLPDVGEPAIPSGPTWPGTAWGNKAADIGSKLGYGLLTGTADRVAGPGRMSAPNPYKAGSEEASWYDDQVTKQAADWGPGTALSMVGGAGVVPAEANALRSGLGVQFKNQAKMAATKFEKDKDRVWSGYNSAMDANPLQPAKSPYTDPTPPKLEIPSTVGTPPKKMEYDDFLDGLDEIFGKKKQPTAPINLWQTADPKTIPVGHPVQAGIDGPVGIFKGVMPGGSLNVDWKAGKVLKQAAPAKKEMSTDEALKAIEEALKVDPAVPWEAGDLKADSFGAEGLPPTKPRDILPENEREAARVAGGYTMPSYRGMRVYGQNDINPVYKGPELYHTADPMLADMYSSSLSAHPGHEVPQGTFGSGSNVSPLLVDTRNYYHADAKGAIWSSFNRGAIEKAKAEGKHGVVIDNVWDEPGSTKALDGPKRIFITFPEGASSVKSRFAARFDPTSSNMLHGIGAAIGGGSAGYLLPGQDAPVQKAGGGGLSLTPVDGDPFAAPAGQPSLTPVDHDPFAAEQQPSVGADMAKSAGTYAAKGLIDFAGMPGDVGNTLARGSKAATDYLADTFGFDKGPELAKPVLPTSAGTQKAIEGVTGKFYEPKTTAGKYTGAVAETLANPLSYVGPGGVLSKLAMGAASGAGGEAAAEAAEGSGYEGLARVGGSLLGGPLAARTLKPQLAPAQQMLADRGVTQMTPGQLTGGLLKDFEDKLTSVPLLGHLIQNSRGRSIESFNRSVADQALAPIGERLAARTPAGHEAVAEVERKLSNAYDHIVPNISLRPDPQWYTDLRNIYDRNVQMLPQDHQQQFQRIINQEFGRPGAPLAGEQVKVIESNLNRLGRKFSGSQDANQQLLGEALNSTLTAVRSNMERMNPAFAQELQRINQGWAMYDRIRMAAANRRGSEGVFTPGDLLTAVKRGDTSVKKGSFARGNALMQRFAEAGQSILPSKVPDSGTAGRTLASLITTGGLGFLSPKVLGGLGAASLPYNRPAMALLNRYVRPTTGVRADYANAGRGAGTLRPLLQGNPFGGMPNPFGP